MTSQDEQTDDVKVFFGGHLITFRWEDYDRLVTTDEQGEYSAFSFHGWRDFVWFIEQKRPTRPIPTIPQDNSTLSWANPPVGGKSCACACHDKGPIQPGCPACTDSPSHQQVKTRYSALTGSL